MADDLEHGRDASAWTRTFYPRTSAGVGFERVVFFCDAVFAIALTLAAVEIGVPEITGDASSPAELWQALVDKAPALLAFLVAFAWVALYWLANHRFTATLRGVNSAYLRAMLVYLALIALLPIPASMLGEYFENPMAVVVFVVYVCLVSGMEVVLLWVADRGDLFVAPLSPEFRRQQLLGSASPLLVFTVSIPLAFVSPTLAVVFWFAGGVALGFVMSRVFRAQAPPDPAGELPE